MDTETTTLDSESYVETEPAVSSSPSEVQPADETTAGSEEIITFISSEDELLFHVRNIEEIEMYRFGILLVGIAVALSIVIIKTFFGKGV